MSTDNPVVCCPPVFRYKKPSAIEYSVFLAGTIDMGNSEDWQQAAISRLQDRCSVIYNPRRTDWDSNWVQELTNPQFNSQVTWELEMLDKADIVFMYFDPTSQSPISLLELGWLAAKKPQNTYVCCPPGYWRKGNVDIVCNRFGITVYNSLEVALTALRCHCDRVYDKYKVK